MFLGRRGGGTSIERSSGKNRFVSLPLQKFLFTINGPVDDVTRFFKFC